MEVKQVVLQTKLGQLRGYTRQSVFSGKSYYAFQGIPYAKPPLGELRFKAPQPFGSWEGIRDALEDGNDPKQPIMVPLPGMDPTTIVGDEDCLYLNVFMNEIPEKINSKKPVMFSIHGGGFQGGSGSMKSNGPDFLLEGDVIVVTINYRCGAFGFLSLENEEVPGNAGLKDQTLALKWVRDNIESFGGNPNNVTIFGISAGGSSVSFHLLSPFSRGLFHKAIIQSGFCLSPWAVQQAPLSTATELARAMGFKTENTDEILLFLQSASADDIILATKKTSNEKKFLKQIGYKFSPCVEVSGTEPFLADTPANLIKKEGFLQVPIILGGCVNEGSVLTFFNGVSENEFASINTNHELLVPSYLGLTPGSAKENEVSNSLWEFYLKEETLSWDNISDYLTYASDLLYNNAMAKTRNSLVETSSSPVYSYLFTNHSRCICFGLKHILSEDFAKTISSETCHGADCMFLYNFNIIPQELTPTEKEAILKYVKAWTTFASTGDPNCKELGATWERDCKDKPCYMDIGTAWTMKDGIPFEDRIDFWKKLVSKL